ncbi:MAG TPA: hypothetical protein DD396_07405 [Bacteroidetes bacterium]|jgi:hypothetical protein|nr:hypothetical protein [Bacteroidota bacterium]
MEETELLPKEETKSKKGPLFIFIFLFLGSLAFSGYLFLKYTENAKKIQSQNDELSLAYEVLNLNADSLRNALDIAKQDIDARMTELANQSNLHNELRSQLEAKKISLDAAYTRIKNLITGEEKGGVATGAEPKNLLEAKREIAKLTKSNNAYMNQIEGLQKEYEIAKTKSAEYAGIASTLKVDNDSLVIVNDSLSKKLTGTGSFKIGNLNVEPIRTRNGKVAVEDHASKVEQIKVFFKVLISEYAKEEVRNIRVRVITPNGAVLSEENNDLMDSDQVNTIVESIMYDGTEKAVSLYYHQQGKYAKGEYDVEIFDNNTLLGIYSFILI